MGVKTGTHSDLVTACLGLLQMHGVYCWRQANQGTYDAARNRFRAFHGLRGVSDILGALDGGRILCVECKTGRGKLTDDQREFLRVVGALGGLAICVRSVVALESALRQEGVIR